MIKPTFYRLPEEKRRRVIQAIVDEFSAETADRVSINRIIKAADISRGSFYQYFDDKVDLVEVLMSRLIEASTEKVMLAIEESGGDIFYTYEKLFDAVAEYSADPTRRRVLKNLAHNIKANDSLVSDYLLNRFKGVDGDCLVRHFSREGLSVDSDEQMCELNRILTLVLKNAVFNFLCCGEDCSEARRSFMNKLELIKTGAAKHN